MPEVIPSKGDREREEGAVLCRRSGEQEVTRGWQPYSHAQRGGRRAGFKLEFILIRLHDPKYL